MMALFLSIFTHFPFFQAAALYPAGWIQRWAAPPPPSKRLYSPPVVGLPIEDSGLFEHLPRVDVAFPALMEGRCAVPHLH